MKRERFGTFSSSSMWKLMEKDKHGGFGKPAKTYIKQVNYERKLGRAINKEHNAKPTVWGTFIEQRAFNLLGLDYKLVSQERLFHPDIEFWSGAPDLVKLNTVCDVKSPFNLEVFCDKLNALKDIETYKKEYPEDYYQHISNAILLEKNGISITHFEAILYVPFIDELDEIREETGGIDTLQKNLAWINYSENAELPYILRNTGYNNLNVFRFEIPIEDKQELTQRVIEAGKLLINE